MMRSWGRETEPRTPKPRRNEPLHRDVDAYAKGRESSRHPETTLTGRSSSPNRDDRPRSIVSSMTTPVGPDSFETPVIATGLCRFYRPEDVPEGSDIRTAGRYRPPARCGPKGWP